MLAKLSNESLASWSDMGGGLEGNALGFACAPLIPAGEPFRSTPSAGRMEGPPPTAEAEGCPRPCWWANGAWGRPDGCLCACGGGEWARMLGGHDHDTGGGRGGWVVGTSLGIDGGGGEC